MTPRIAPREDFRFQVQPLARAHDRAAFSCGVDALDNYLKTQARQDVAKRIAVCFILTPDSRAVAGFYTLSQYAVSLAGLPSDFASRLPRYPEAPATLLGRFAIGEEFRGQRLGEFLLMDALKRSWQLSKQVASLAVIVDAKDEAASRFYKHFDFISLPSTPNRLFLPMKTIESLFR